MSKIKNVDYESIDLIMGAIGAVLKAVVGVAKCIDSLKTVELNKKPTV